MTDYHQLLFPYAYNILGTIDLAQDAIQDVLTSFLSAKKDHIENEKSYLIRAVINRSINIKQKNDKLRSNDIWLPEPIATERSDAEIQRQEILSYSMLILLEQLNAKERAVFILKEAFDYSHEEISTLLSISTENSRKLLSRGRTKLANDHKVFPSQVEKVPIANLETYIKVIQERDFKALEALLAKDVTLASDGGGKVKATRKRINGSDPVTRFLIGIYHKFKRDVNFTSTEYNHQPAILYRDNKQVYNCQVFTFQQGKISQIHNVLDPDKLRHIRSSDTVTF